MRVKHIYISVVRAAGLKHTSEELAREQYRALTKQVPILYIILMINSLFMAFAVREGGGIFLTFSFPAIALPMMCIRFFVWSKRSKRPEQLGIEHIRKLLLGNVFAAAFIAFLLRFWAVAIMFVASEQYYTYIPIFTILSLITCSYCLKALPAATYAVICTGTTCIVTAMLMSGEIKMMLIAANMTVITGLIIYMVSMEFNQMRHLVDSRSKMIEQRTDARRLANRDPLTDMPNRRAFLDAL